MTRFFDMPKTTRAVEVHGFAMRVIRTARGKSVAQLAEEIGKDRSYITHLENGTKRTVSPELYAALCHALLIQGEDHRALLAVAPERFAEVAGL